MLLLLLSFLWQGVSAGTDTLYVLPEMTVTATRLEADVSEIGQRVQRIDAIEIERTGSRSLADVLSRNSTAYIRRYGPSGLASISLRGTGASQTSILLDGRRISDPQLGQLDLSLIPVDMLSSVEVLHGSSSAIYGSEGIGGAINLRTATAVPGHRVSVRASGGRFGEREVVSSARVGDGRTGLSVVARMQTSQNDFKYFSRALGEEVRVQGADRDQAALYAGAFTRLGRTEARLSVLHTTSERGIPAGSGLLAHERQDDAALRIWTDVRQSIGRGYLRGGALVQRSTLRYENRLLRLDDTGRTTLSTIELEGGSRFGLWNALVGVEAGRADVEHPSLTHESDEHRIAGYAQAHGPLLSTTLFPSMRIDRYAAQSDSDKGGVVRLAFSPTLALNTPVAGNVRLRASAGRSFRMPTFNDRFWSPGGNHDLQPERGWTVDAGLIYAGDRHRGDFSVFRLDTRDQITWTPTALGYWAPSNLSRTVVHGLETTYQIHGQIAGSRFSAHGSYRLADARDRSDETSATFGMPLRYRPAHVANASGSLALGAIDINLGATMTGRTYTTDDRSRWIDPYAIVHGGMSYRIPVGQAEALFSARVENLFDSDYAIVENRPMPPRHFRFTIQLTSSSR